MSLGLQLLFTFFGFVLGHAKTALIFFQVPIVQIIFFWALLGYDATKRVSNKSRWGHHRQNVVFVYMEKK